MNSWRNSKRTGCCNSTAKRRTAVEHFSDESDDDDDDDARTGLFEGDEMEHDKLKPASDSE